MTSFLESTPSPSLSYLEKIASMSLVLSLATARLTALSLAPRALMTVASTTREHSLICCSSFARPCFASEGWPGAAGRGSFIAGPFWRMNSVQARARALASPPASSTARAVACTSATLSSATSSSRGAAMSLRCSAPASAAARRCSSSRMSWRACSSSSRWCRSSASFFSCSFRRCSLTCSMRFRACSMPLSLSSVIRCFWLPVFRSSRRRISSSSFRSASKLSGVAVRTFCTTRRIARVDFCSWRRFSSTSFFRFASSSRFRCSSSRRRFSSACFRASSSCFRRAASSSPCFRRLSSCSLLPISLCGGCPYPKPWPLAWLLPRWSWASAFMVMVNLGSTGPS
mmetsp:Transcript_117139/g.331935  ORF Transcript_117139/g.331935 Transcript_117139/m.331935 type:complete len:343 (-) Transcript_117139:18-1046(-)